MQVSKSSVGSFAVVSSRFSQASSKLADIVRKELVLGDPAAEVWTLGLQVNDSDTGVEQPFLAPRSGEADSWGFDATHGAGFRHLLVMLAVLASSLSFLSEVGVRGLQELRSVLCACFYRIESSCILEAIFDAVLLFIARLATLFAPLAAGSGLPEVKCILSGLPMSKFLSKKVLVAKVIGLTCSIGSGLPVGREGPFVHIASCVAANLADCRMFANANIPQQEILLAAVSIGVGATFSAPVGGVLFALELMMPRMYDASSYAACFFASTVSTLTYMMLNMGLMGNGIKPLFNADLPSVHDRNALQDLLFICLCVTIGALGGLLGGLFVLSHRYMVRVMNAVRRVSTIPGSKAGQSLWRDMFVLAVVAVAGAVVRNSTGIRVLRLPLGQLLTELFSSSALPEFTVSSMGLVLVWKWFHTSVGLALPVPAGVVAPTLVLGALVGRLIGATLPDCAWSMIADEDEVDSYTARLAIVGAAALCGSVCHVVSVVVTVFELVAVPSLILPMALATLSANFCANLVAPSIFDTILIMKKVRAMPTLFASRQAFQSIQNIMSNRLLSAVLPRQASVADIDRVDAVLQELASEGIAPIILPLVEELPGNIRLLCGAIATDNLHELRKIMEKALGAQDQRDFMMSTSCGGIDDMRIGFGDPTLRSRQGCSHQRFDLACVVAQNGLSVSTIQVDPKMTLKKAYLRSQSMHNGGSLMVVDQGSLVGIVTYDQILNLSRSS